LALDFLVGLHLDIRLSPLEAILLIYRYQAVKQQGISAFGPILRQNAYEQEIDGISLMELQGTEDMPPAEGEESAFATFLQSPAQ
jgi:hypothetical protein